LWRKKKIAQNLVRTNEEILTISSIYPNLSTGQEALKIRDVFDIIVEPVWQRTVIHSPVIHSLRIRCALFLPPDRHDPALITAEAVYIFITEWRMTE